jgi:hypothetical protein
MAQSCTARSSGLITIPRHCSWVRPPERARRVAAATSDAVRPAEPSWARTVSNRRLLVCKSEPDCPPRFTRCHSVLECRVQRLVRVTLSTDCRAVFARLGTLLARVRSLLRGGLAFSLPGRTIHLTCRAKGTRTPSRNVRKQALNCGGCSFKSLRGRPVVLRICVAVLRDVTVLWPVLQPGGGSAEDRLLVAGASQQEP